MNLSPYATFVASIVATTLILSGCTNRAAPDGAAEKDPAPATESKPIVQIVPQPSREATPDKAPAAKRFHHPSLQIEYSKRPLVELKDLIFADEKLKRDTEQVQRVFERIIGKEVFGEHYKDVRYDNNPRFVGSWRTSPKPRGNTHQESQRPGQELSLVLGGSLSKDNKDRINLVEVGANFVPSEGWRAAASFSLSAAGKGRYFNSGSAGVALIDREVQRYGDPLPMFSLTRNYVTTEVRESPTYSYRYQVYRRLSFSERHSAATRVANSRAFRALFVSPASLRDTVLAEFDELRRTAQAEISNLQDVEFVEFRPDADSDSSIETYPASKRPPSDEIKRQLLENIVKELDARSETVRKHHEAMHAALTRALPLLELPDDFVTDDAAPIP